jgi:L-seryl-tRNA(Ser) seleniumtransferase
MHGVRSGRLRDLPSVDAVLNTPTAADLLDRFGRKASTQAIRDALQEARAALRAEGGVAPAAEDIAMRGFSRLREQDRSTLRPLFNLTGTVLHTNFGRAAFAEAAIEAAVAAMRDAVALEFDLLSGARGERDDHIRALLCALTGAEAATVVNNNAAAVLVCLNTLAAGRDAIVSRGELIEIGGAFRMPDIMARAGARLVEVGTTNRTHTKDYSQAVTAETGTILKVHTSNYRIQGFTADVMTAELAEIARAAKIALLHDLGSGVLVDLGAYGLPREPTVREVVANGADLVTFSGDKLLGGPQAGFIVGRRDLIVAINRNPMKRALRVDKVRLAAIEATLKLYRDPDRLAERLPTFRFLARPLADIVAQAERVLPRLTEALGHTFDVEVSACKSQIGSGALPLETIPSAGLAIRAHGGGRAIEDLASRLRALPRPVIGRIDDGRLMLDLRCLRDEAGFISNLADLSPEAPTPRVSPGGTS